jgi:hypothetical protein
MHLRRIVLLALAVASCQTAPSDDQTAATPTDTTTPAGSTGTPVADSTEAVQLRTDKAQYRAGDRVTLTLANRTGSTFAFNPCTRTIENQSGTAWTAVAEEGRMCTMEAWMLEPNQTRTADTELPSTLRPGPHRVIVELTREGAAAGATAATAAPDRVRATSPAITIVP